MKIAVVGTRGFPGVQGGVEIHCEQLYTHLVKLGCTIAVFTRKPYVAPGIHTYKGVSLIPINCPRNKFLEAISHTFKSVLMAPKLKPDILHIHAIGPSLFMPLARLLGLKVVMTHHGENYKHMKWGFFARQFLRFCEAVGIMFCNSIIAISPTIASTIERKYRIPPVIIPNGVYVSAPAITEEILVTLGIERHKYILSVGRFVPEKGLSDLIDAFNSGDFGDWKLVIVGRADHEDKYSRDLKVKSSKNKNIVLPGFLTGKSLHEIYSHAGLFVLPSYYEGLSIVLLEAISYGLSCIISDIPANRNIGLLSDSRFFKPGDVTAIAEKMKEFIDKPLQEDERKKQVSMIAEKYNWEKIAAKTLEVYKQVILKN